MSDQENKVSASVIDPMKPDEIKGLRAPRTLTKYGKHAWAQSVRSLSPARIISHGDLLTLEMGCLEYQRWRQFEDEIGKRNKAYTFAGELDKTPNGFHQLSQLRILADRAKTGWLKIAGRFGLTPLDRARIQDSAQGDFFQFLETDDGKKKRDFAEKQRVDPTDPMGLHPRVH